tara:strand:+ start:1312 stop:1830 length:519 start_codon:yes stop_codon:yes gene_type:complete
MRNKANVIAVALIGIGFWVGVIYLFISDQDTPQADTSRHTVPNSRSTPEENNNPAQTVTSFSDAKSKCPTDPECILQGLLADYGNICKSWVKLETERHYTTSSEGQLKRIFHTAEASDETQQHWRLQGDAFYDHGTGTRYWYGCEVDTQTGDITGIAPPVPVGTPRRYKAFN